MRRRHDVLIALAFFGLGLATRLYKLGAWSPGYDEPATLLEVGSLLGVTDADPMSQTYRLPRMIPIGFLLQGVGYELFGTTVSATRMMPALLSALCLPVAYAGLRWAKVGWISAATATFFIATWHRHLFYAQLNRFYAAAFLVVLAVIIATVIGVERRSRPWYLVALLLSVAALLTHVVQGIVLLLPMAGLAAITWHERRLDRGLAAATLAVIGLVVLLFFGYVAPLARGWNRTMAPTSPVRVALHTVPDLGIHIFPLAAIGLYSEWKRKRPIATVWTASLIALAAIIFVVPALVPFRNAYSFPLLGTLLILAGFGGGEIIRALSKTSIGTAAGAAALLAALQIPAFVSYYRDGSRYDHRAAAEHIRAGRGANETVFAHYKTYWSFKYPDVQIRSLPEIDGQPQLAKHLESATTATWVALSYGRPGLPQATRALLGKFRCTETFEARKRRFDYYVHQIRVFRCPPVR